MAYTRVNWQDLPSTTTPINATNLNKMDAGIKNNDDRLTDLEGYVLYNNASSTITTGTVPLSDNATNYDYLDVLYKENNGVFNSVRIVPTNNSYFSVAINYIENNAVYIKCKIMQVSTNTLVHTANARTIAISTTGVVTNGDGNTIRITKVIGYK